MRSVYFVARPNIHVARCPRFSCASTSYFVRFPRIDIVFVYRRLLYINIYIFVFVFASFVLSLALPRVCSSIPCRSIGNRLSVKLVTSWVIFCAAFRTVSNLVSNTRHLRNRSLGVNVSLISESIRFFFLSPRLIVFKQREEGNTCSSRVRRKFKFIRIHFVSCSIRVR